MTSLVEETSSKESASSEDEESNTSSSDDLTESTDEEQDDNEDQFEGEMFNNRYFMIKQLGKGFYSSVWLAYDCFDISSSNFVWQNKPYVAIKVQFEEDESEAKKEISLLDDIAEHALESNLARMLNSFEHKERMCMVFPCYGQNLDGVLHAHERLSNSQSKSIIRQLLKALDVLHTKEYSHCDIKPGNIMLKNPVRSIRKTITKFEECKPISIIKNINPKKGKKGRRDGRNREGVGNIKLIHAKFQRHLRKIKPINREKGEDASDDDLQEIVLTDFGNSKSRKRQFKIIEFGTQHYMPPELLSVSASTKADIWAVACIAYELLTGDVLFYPKHTDTYSTNQVHLGLIYSKLGNIGGWPVPCDFPVFKPEALESKYITEDAAHFMKTIFVWNPMSRPDARTMLKHPWLC